MMTIAAIVGASCDFLSQYRSRSIVNSKVNRLKAINMGTFKPPVPIKPNTTLSTLTKARGEKTLKISNDNFGRDIIYVTGDIKAI